MMPFVALVYVESLAGVDNDGKFHTSREEQPRDITVVFGSATGSSPTRDAAAMRWHRDLKLAANQRVVFVQTDRALLNRVRKAQSKALANNQSLPFVDAWLLVKSRLRGKRQRQRAYST